MAFSVVAGDAAVGIHNDQSVETRLYVLPVGSKTPISCLPT
jgi:hypothetical protein